MPENMKSLNGYRFDAEKLNGKPGSEYASAESLRQLKDDLADAWTSGKTYAVGDYVISENKLWRCKVTHNSTAKPTEDSNWTQCRIAAEIKTLNEHDAQSDPITIKQIGTQTTEIAFKQRPSVMFLIAHLYSTYSDAVPYGFAFIIKIDATIDTDIGSMILKEPSTTEDYLKISGLAFDGSTNTMTITWNTSGNRIVTAIPYY